MSHCFRLETAGEAPATRHGSWKHPDTGLSVEAAVVRLWRGGNVGVAGHGGRLGRDGVASDRRRREELLAATQTVELPETYSASRGDSGATVLEAPSRGEAETAPDHLDAANDCVCARGRGQHDGYARTVDDLLSVTPSGLAPTVSPGSASSALPGTDGRRTRRISARTCSGYSQPPTGLWARIDVLLAFIPPSGWVALSRRPRGCTPRTGRPARRRLPAALRELPHAVSSTLGTPPPTSTEVPDPDIPAGSLCD